MNALAQNNLIEILSQSWYNDRELLPSVKAFDYIKDLNFTIKDLERVLLVVIEKACLNNDNEILANIEGFINLLFTKSLGITKSNNLENFLVSKLRDGVKSNLLFRFLNIVFSLKIKIPYEDLPLLDEFKPHIFAQLLFFHKRWHEALFLLITCKENSKWAMSVYLEQYLEDLDEKLRVLFLKDLKKLNSSVPLMSIYIDDLLDN